MNVLVSKTCGLCYGSNNAITKTRESLNTHKNVVLYKEILHNQNVINELEKSNARTVNELSDIKENDYVIIRAHGEPYSTYEYFKNNNISYLDCTCPNVTNIHNLVNKYNNLDYKIIIIGKKNHPEVTGTKGWCNEPIIIENEEDIENINTKFDKYFLVIQTTFNKDKALELLDKIKNHLKDKVLEYKNTICNAQKLINDDSIKLANEVDLMVVIGGKHSSNSIELYNNISKVKKAIFIENINELDTYINNDYFNGIKKIGITAGASTLKEDIIEVKRKLESLQLDTLNK